MRRTSSVRAYAALVRLLLPPRFRDQFAAEMALVFADLDAAARERDGCRGALRAFGAELSGLIRLAIRERRAERLSRAHRPNPSSRDEDMLESLMQDLRFAGRSLRRTPGFACVAVLTLALGVGANTAIFSVVNGVLLTPLRLAEPERLVALGETQRSSPATALSVTSPASFYDWKASSRTMRIAGFTGSQGTLTGRAEPEVLTGTTSVGGLFEVLGVPPLFGRTLTIADEDPAAPRAIVLSYDAWHRLYGEDRGVIGKTLTLNGTARTIVGVMPPSFRFPAGGLDFWAPSRYDAAFRANRDQYWIQPIGRLEHGATIGQARAEMDVVARRLMRDWPTYNTDLRIAALPLQETIVSGARTQLYLLMGAVAFVLLITCANLGNLLLARAGGRRREIAIRQALGAGRARVARQLLTESLLLAIAGGVAGLAVGRWFLRLLLAAQVTTNIPRADEVTLDARVLLFTLAVSVFAGLFFGSIPAWQLARGRSSEALREGSRGSSGNQWMRNVLVVSELALAMVLLTGAGLLLRSFALLQGVNPGIAADHVLTFTANVRNADEAFATTSLGRMRAIPGVRSAAMVSRLPISGRGVGAWFNRIDRPLPPGVKPTGEPYRVVTPDYFATVGIPARQGRLLTSADTKSAPGVVINEALAKKYYPNEDPLGKPVYLGAPDNRLFDRAAIVGVVADTRDAGLGSAALPTIYVPLALMPTWSGLSYVVRTTGAPTLVAPAAREVIRALDPTAPVRNVRTLESVVEDAVAPARWSTTLLGTFAGVALVIAVLGVFGVLSFLVTQRTRELGIRIALGAASSAVLRMIVARGLLLVGAGVGLGLVGAVALTRFMATMLYGVTPTDPLTYTGVAAVLMAAALVACYLPARRATRVDPIIALRAE